LEPLGGFADAKAGEWGKMATLMIMVPYTVTPLRHKNRCTKIVHVTLVARNRARDMAKKRLE
jgi:hypothetical protein